MSKIVPTPTPGFDNLPVDEQMNFVQSIWDRIAATPEQVPVPAWHRQIIRERLEAYPRESNQLVDSGRETSAQRHCAQVARSLI